MTASNAVSDPLWVLRRATDRHLHCWVTEATPELWFVTVSYGSETMLTETYPTFATAMLRATSLKDLLMGSGWRPANADAVC